MAGNLKIGDLEARKRALVTESEICREALKTELDNLRIHSGALMRKFDRVRSVGPWLMLAAPVFVPLLGVLLRKQSKPAARPSGMKRPLAAGLVALRLYRKYGPLVRAVVGRLKARKRSAAEARYT